MKFGVKNWLATAIAGEWQSGLLLDLTNLNKVIAEIEATNLARHYACWHIPHLGRMEQQQPDGTFQFLGGQLNSAFSTEVCTCKVNKLLWLISDWEVQAGGLSEVGVNWGTYPSSANLALWFWDKIPDICTHTAHNAHEKVAHHQPGRTTTFCCADHRGLGRWCSTQIYADPHHCFWLVLAYNVG